MEELIIARLVHAIPHLKGLYLFGSRAAGEETADSDWDFAFLTDHPFRLDPVRRFELQEELAARLNADVDLVDLRAVSTVMGFEILSKGKRIYCADEYYCNTFEMLTYSFYQRLQEERKEILKAIRERGSIYG